MTRPERKADPAVVKKDAVAGQSQVRAEAGGIRHDQ
jgi:hypothetical protein